MAALVPTRPANKKYPLTQEQQDCLTYYVLMGCSKQEAFILFFPEFLKYGGTKVIKGVLTAAGEQYCKQLFSSSIAMDYIREYMDTVTNKVKQFAPKSTATATPEVMEKRKSKALNNLLENAMSLVEQSNLDADAVKTVADIFNKLGMLKDEVEVPEAPRRYLPEKCTSCLYRSFVESYAKTGQIENSCLRCKALKCAEDSGFMYDPTQLLE